MPDGLRILIAEDNEMVRRGVALLPSEGKNWSVCGGASNSEEVLKQAEELHPDVILRDVSVPSIAGLEIDNTSADAGELSDTRFLSSASIIILT